MEKYNKYGESLYIDCGCKEKIPKNKKSNNCCGGINLPSHDNEIEVLIRQLKREVKELLKNTQCRLLCQDKKISETMVYIKNNLSNAIRDLLDSMLNNGELDDIITDTILDSIEELEKDIETLSKFPKSNLNYERIGRIINKTPYCDSTSGQGNNVFTNMVVYLGNDESISLIKCNQITFNSTGVMSVNTNPDIKITSVRGL